MGTSSVLFVYIVCMICMIALPCFAEIINAAISFPDADEDVTTISYRVKTKDDKHVVFNSELSESGEVLYTVIEYADEEFFERNKDEERLSKKVTVVDTEGRELIFEFIWTRSGTPEKRSFNIVTATITPAEEPVGRKSETYTLLTTEDKKIHIEFRFTD